MKFDPESQNAKDGLTAQAWLIREFEKLQEDETLRDRPRVTPIREWIEGCGVAAGQWASLMEREWGDVIATDIDGRPNRIEAVVSPRATGNFALSSRKLDGFIGEWFAFLTPKEGGTYDVSFVRRNRVLDTLETSPEVMGDRGPYKLLNLEAVRRRRYDVLDGVRKFYDAVLARAN